MLPMLNGIVLEAFKKGLAADLLYALSVQEPANLEAAIKIAQRVERYMKGDDRYSNVRTDQEGKIEKKV